MRGNSEEVNKEIKKVINFIGVGCGGAWSSLPFFYVILTFSFFFPPSLPSCLTTSYFSSNVWCAPFRFSFHLFILCFIYMLFDNNMEISIA